MFRVGYSSDGRRWRTCRRPRALALQRFRVAVSFSRGKLAASCEGKKIGAFRSRRREAPVLSGRISLL